jgi:hypothetical protein
MTKQVFPGPSAERHRAGYEMRPSRLLRERTSPPLFADFGSRPITMLAVQF